MLTKDKTIVHVSDSECYNSLSGKLSAKTMPDTVSGIIFTLGKSPVFHVIIVVVRGENNIQLQGDILIDDKPLIKGKDEPRWFHVLFTAAHNTHVTEYHSNQMRLDTWDKEALDKLIEEIKQKKAAK